MRIYLASQSPRRRALLIQAGIHFDTILLRQGLRMDEETDETPLAGENAVQYVERVARAKAGHGWSLVGLRKLKTQPVLAADTILEIDGEIVGKPENDGHAFDILRKLSGRAHRVLTGVAIQFESTTDYVLSESEVRFRKLEEEEIRHYLLSGEHRDKAGAYGIQGRASLFVEHLSGDYSGVMGLPLCQTGILLGKLGYRPL